jgi:hypothetical protein
VPSAIVEGSYNVLINPQRATISELVVESVQPFGFDPRLVR